MPRTVDIETFGEPHAVRLRVLRHRKKPVASRHTARPKRLTQDRVRYNRVGNAPRVSDVRACFLDQRAGRCPRG